MSGAQKQKRYGEDDDEADKKPAVIVKDDDKAKGAVQKAKDILGKLDEASKRKGGHWEECCGVRIWIPD